MTPEQEAAAEARMAELDAQGAALTARMAADRARLAAIYAQVDELRAVLAVTDPDTDPVLTARVRELRDELATVLDAIDRNALEAERLVALSKAESKAALRYWLRACSSLRSSTIAQLAALGSEHAHSHALRRYRRCQAYGRKAPPVRPALLAALSLATPTGPPAAISGGPRLAIAGST